MFVKAPHSPIKHPPHHQICILIAFWLHFPPLRLLFIGASFLLRRHRHPQGAHLQQRTRTELRRKLLQLECNWICTPAHLDSWTQRSHLPGEAWPLMHKKIQQIYMCCTIVPINQWNKHYRKTKTQMYASLMSYIPPSSSSVFSFFLWIVFTTHSLPNSFLNKCLERCESFNDWIE